MKKVFATAMLAIGFYAAQAQSRVSEVSRFTPETIQLGSLKQGVPATATFTVLNTSSKPLTIEKAIPGCGCTLAEYTKSPILPGKSGTITATYNAAAAGAFSKAITVKFAGIDDVATLTISGEVKAAPATAAAN